MTETQMRKAIKKIDAAVDALSDIFYAALDAQGKDPERVTRDDAIVRLKRDLRELSDYLERAEWWRK